MSKHYSFVANQRMALKRTTLPLIIALFCMSTLHAQLGVKGGINVSSWRGESTSNSSSKLGYYGGVFYNLPITEMISIQPEVVYSSEGAKSKDGSTIKYTTNFINLTPLIRYNSGGFFGGTGPQIGILTSAKLEYQGDKTDVKDLFKSTNFSWAFAVGYELESGLGAYARYNLGLSNFSGVDGAELKTSAFHVGLRYRFNNGEK